MNGRVAYVGNFDPEWSTENDLRIGFEALGWEVVQLQESRTGPDVLRKTALESDLLLWTSTWGAPQPHHTRAYEVASECAAKGIPSACYHLDLLWGLARAGLDWRSNSMWQMAHFYTADGGHQAEFNHEFGEDRHRWLPAGVRHTATEPGHPRREHACDVAFAGADNRRVHYHPEWTYRRDLVDFLEAMCERRGWTFRNPGGRSPKVPRECMNDFYASAKVTVGDSLCPDREDSLYWSDRAYEATGRGGLLIMPEMPALQEQFDGHLPTYPWSDFDRLERIIAHLLDNPAERAEIRRHTWEIARDRHTYKHRAQAILEAEGLA